MAGEWRGGRDDQDAIRPDKEEHEHTHGRPHPDVEGEQGADQAGTIHWEGDDSQKVVVNLTARRVRIDPQAKRAQYLNRLELLIQELDAIIADPEGFEDIQVEAMDVLIKAVRLCYTIVRDVDVELLENELEEIKKRNREAQEGRGDEELGYELPEEPPR